MKQALPLPYRVLLALLFRGPESEWLLGDLQESYNRNLELGVTRVRARANLRKRVTHTLVSWGRVMEAKPPHRLV